MTVLFWPIVVHIYLPVCWISGFEKFDWQKEYKASVPGVHEICIMTFVADEMEAK